MAGARNATASLRSISPDRQVEADAEVSVRPSTSSGLSGGSGNSITLRHANGYVTQYLHLSKRLVRKGDRVKQGQRIGLVGMTGLATGPHVDIRIRNNGHYMNWETLKLPRQSRITAASLQTFEEVRDRFTAMMASGPDSGTKLASRDAAPTAAP